MANFTTDGKICIDREVSLPNMEEHIVDVVTHFDVEKTCVWITENQFLKVCLQFPDELLGLSAKVYEEIKKRVEVDLYILGDTSYASCCVDTVAAMHVQANAVVHYGHTCFSKANLPVFMVLPKRHFVIDVTMKILKDNFGSDTDVRLCLFYDPEFECCKEEISRHWFKNYPQSCIAYIEQGDSEYIFQGRLLKNAHGEPLPLEYLKDYICVHIGSRGQTVFNYTVSVPAKEWYLLDPDQQKVEHLEETAWFKRRRFLIEKCKDANVIGILVCKLAGDQTRDIISRMKQLCRSNGKKSYIISVGKPNVAKLANFPEIDIYVMIACPENDLYNSRDFYKPIVYPYELEVAINLKRDPYFTNHVTDYDELLPGKRHYCDIEHLEEGGDVSLVTGKIRETKLGVKDGNSTDLVTKQNWALENIGSNLQAKTWRGLEQKLGETEAKMAEQGRQGIPLQYNNEPE
ncbi:2-(3-amino-3-carboxypropyl)histidine synthase subunit 2 [Plodia interpunctella]|uniref:2-(3-amino-3-carboxypropyl)histidine synthase subunit 2 n=1 Tax=Plodia interpunctella TaxID=58824 RepID=UPI00236784C5|nr:2-(3-amino-3-carboxypropyl)histidine synthase subunit 2 [Plodia interpunctella]